MVMDEGRVAEIGRPVDLLSNPTSMLSALVDSTGVAAAQQLRALAVAASAAAPTDGTTTPLGAPVSVPPLQLH
jgi:hypothetical protein